MNIVIIASLSQEDTIKEVANHYKNLGHIVDYPVKQPDKEFSQIVEDYLYRISLADTVIAITKQDGTFGEGVTYELAFAKFLNKPIHIIKEDRYFMNVAIFTRDESRAKEIGQEIIDKFFSSGILGSCVMSNNGNTFKFPEKNIVIDIRLDWSSSVLDLNPRYFLLDETSGYDFNEFVRQQLIMLTDTEEVYNLRKLIMSIIETSLYGDE